MTDVECPVAYDHNDDLDQCEVCGWTGIEPSRPGPYDGLPDWLKPDHLIGPPRKRIVLCSDLLGGDDD